MLNSAPHIVYLQLSPLEEMFPAEHSRRWMRNNDRVMGQRRGCRNKVKLQSQADPGNTSAVTSDDNHQVLSTERDRGLRERAIAGNGGMIQMRH